MSYKYDKQFLKELHGQQIQTKYVRLIALDQDEKPIETIEGRATGGSINIDGASKKQRTCSGIVLQGENLTIHDVNWAIKTKFKVEIGLKNDINPSYPNIIWFNQGVYGINSFSANQSLNTITVNIGGQDKMAYLDGTFGGTIPMQNNFGVEDYIQPNGDIITTSIPIYKIIKEAVHVYGHEPYHNIIINDLDDYGYELWQYRGGSKDTEEEKISPLYYFYKNNQVENMTFYQDMIVYQINQENEELTLIEKTLSQLDETSLYIQNSAFTTGANFCLKKYETQDDIKNNQYKISRIEYGDTAGYHRTPLIYPGELILNAGETITSLLDKIVAVLGEFEYFYDLNGKFIFQKKKNYIQELLTPISKEVREPVVHLSKYSYEFDENSLSTQASISPNIKDIKNDFVVWGNKKAITNLDIPIHIRLAVCEKPKTYVLPCDYYQRIFLYSLEVISNETTLPTGYKWYIYDNTSDCYRPANKEEIANGIGLAYIKERSTISNNMYIKQNDLYKPYDSSMDLYKRNELTQNFEKYTLNIGDLIPDTLFFKRYNQGDAFCSFASGGEGSSCDWRELIYMMARDYYQHNQNINYVQLLEQYNPWCKNGTTGYEAFYADIQDYWRKLYCPDWELYDFFTQDTGVQYIKADRYQGWNRNAIYDPSSLQFWLDFIEPNGDLAQYSIDKIGIRTKVENKNEITSLFYETTPEVQFIINPTETQNQNYDYGTMNYQPMWIQDSIQELFIMSGRGRSASELISELIYKHLCCAENVNLTTLPIYNLEPNTRIYIKHEDLNIDGDYLLSKLTIPLAYNGTMQLNVTKVMKNLNRVIFAGTDQQNKDPNILLRDIQLQWLKDEDSKFLIVERRV